MGFKEVIGKEKRELTNVKRPYETVAFILFSLLVFQQLFYWVRNLINFMKASNNWFSTANIIVGGNLQGFVVRIINVDSSKWMYVILGLLSYVLYYFLIYVFVWNYCGKRGLAKWTWTLFVVFGPTLVLVPAYVFFVIYVFRPYLARFAKKFVAEFKEFNPNQEFPEDVEPEFNESDYDKYLKDDSDKKKNPSKEKY